MPNSSVRTKQRDCEVITFLHRWSVYPLNSRSYKVRHQGAPMTGKENNVHLNFSIPVVCSKLGSVRNIFLASLIGNIPHSYFCFFLIRRKRAKCWSSVSESGTCPSSSRFCVCLPNHWETLELEVWTTLGNQRFPLLLGIIWGERGTSASTWISDGPWRWLQVQVWEQTDR